MTSLTIDRIPTFFVLAAIATLIAGPLAADPTPSEAEASGSIPHGVDFGAGLTLADPMSLAEVVASPDQYRDTPILLRGRVSDVCQRKGCWTVLQDGEAIIRVRFEDYGFFLPKDASGSEAFVEGLVQVEILSEKTARHYESESSKSASERAKVEGPKREIGFIATGVRLVGYR